MKMRLFARYYEYLHKVKLRSVEEQSESTLERDNYLFIEVVSTGMA